MPPKIKLSADLHSGPRSRFPIERTPFPYQTVCGYPSLHDRAPTVMYCSASLSLIGIDLIQNLPPDGRIKIIKFTAGFCGRPHYGYWLHPAGNPTVRQLPGAIAITELSIPCHLESSCQLVDVAGIRRLRQRSIAISSNVELTYFANRHAVQSPAKNVNNLKKCARGTRVASLFNRS